VVPSMVKDPESGRPVDAVTVLNVAYQLYLDNLPDLMERILDQDAGSAKDRTQWTEKLEQWTLKALSDIALVSAKAGACDVHCWKVRDREALGPRRQGQGKPCYNSALESS